MVVVSPASGGASFPMRPSQPSGSSTSSASAAMSQRRGGSSDGDARDFNSADEDDTDFKSDTLFDSVRTAGSGRVRAVETPLESVYDESPPSTGGNKKSKRLSIQEILDRTWNEDCRIMEEDETSATPVRVTQRPALDQQPGRERKEDTRWFALEPSSSPPDAHQLTHHVGRLCLDDDFDEDWTRDEHDVPFNASPPPSKGHALHASSANINPNVCLALASIGANSVAHPPPPKPGPSHTERALGNLFDWSEPPAHDKQNPTGGALRPQTAYGKQLGDSRGGRSVVRKGPMPMHVRSQSVPVVHEGTDDSKPMGSKYGTWGLGTKTVSEDWDEDFEFGGDNNGPDGKENQDPFAVPESIRASQPSVKAHSGQIRELSLLVNDLKRLCRHGGELNMLNGDQKAVWKEAEGIIALASPDEDRVVHEDDGSGSSVYMDAFEVNGSPAEETHVDVPFEMLDAVMDCNAPAMSKTAVVRERQSPRRRSVFSPDDDIFGANWPLTDERPRSNRPSRPRTPENQPTKTQDVNLVVRSVVETMQSRSVMPVTELSGAQETRKSYNSTNRMQFDTNSLKALVKRAGELRDVLSDMIRKADQLTQSPIRTPRHERRLDSSPAFTRVFDDPGSSPPRRPAKTRGGSSSTLVEQRPSPENSPPSNMSRRVPLMTVI